MGDSWAWTSTGNRWRGSTPSGGSRPSLPTVAWRTSAPVYKDGKQIGYATSGCWSPLLKKYLALAHVAGAALSSRRGRASSRSPSSIIGSARTPSCASSRSSIRRGKRHEPSERPDDTTRSSSAAATTAWSCAAYLARAGRKTLVLERRPSRRRRGRDRRDLSRLQVFSVLICRESSAAGDHTRPRPAGSRTADTAAREHGHTARQRRLSRGLGRSRRDTPRAGAALASRRRGGDRVRAADAPHGDGREADPRHGAARSVFARAVGFASDSSSSAVTCGRWARSDFTRSTS